MSELNLVSIIMPCYRMARYVGDALESIGKQTHTNWEVVAVDDCGPEDGTRAIFDAFAARFPNHRVELIRHEKNGGVSRARNTAIAAAKGNLLAFLDPDDWWLPHHLAQAVEVFSKRPETAVVANPVEAFDENGVMLWEIPAWKIEQFPVSLVYHNFIQPSTVVAAKKVIDEAGGFDTTPELQHIEDYDLWIRLARMEVPFVFLPKASCRYRRHEGGATHDTKFMEALLLKLTEKHLVYFVRMQSKALYLQAGMTSDAQAALKGTFARYLFGVDRILGRWKQRIKS